CTRRGGQLRLRFDYW
nr:immunoglobulin heavy chain junction region [Mus musculus]MBK4184282.1 immunoglobulin heavy chain junction region [Mus musculus]